MHSRARSVWPLAALAAILASLGGCGSGSDEPASEGSRIGALPSDAEATPSGPLSGHMVLILDTSGSMTEKVKGEKRTRFEVAQDVLLNDFVPLISDDMALGLCVFEGSKPKPLAGLVRAGDQVKSGWRHKEWVMEQIELARPRASTPIVASLEWAQSQLLRRTGRRIVVLITDGEETHRPKDVGKTVDALAAAKTELYAIGFNIGSGGRVLAEKLGPRYIEATGGRDSLLSALQSVLASIER
jgi:hypothetical protein